MAWRDQWMSVWRWATRGFRLRRRNSQARPYDGTESTTVAEVLTLSDLVFERLSFEDLITLDQRNSIQSNATDTRRAWALFSIWNLFVGGAVAEHNIRSYIDPKSPLPPPIDSWTKAMPSLLAKHPAWRGHALDKAWRGTSLIVKKTGKPRENAIGALSFLFFFLFLFEGYCKIVLANEIQRSNLTDPTLHPIADQILKPRFSANGVESLIYCIRYRNTWHTFGRHNRKDHVRHSRLPHLTFGPGDVIPIVSEEDTLLLLREMIELLIEIDRSLSI